MREKIAAGIDGGGTGTTLVLLDSKGKQTARETFGPFNPNSIGEDHYRSLLSQIFDTILQAGDCNAVCIGAAGISNPMTAGIAREVAERYGLSDKLLLKGDQEIALYGAMSGKAGAILIAGTGSICFGRNAAGKAMRVGGWGHLIDDVGSGYAIGRDVLRAVVQAHDGRTEKTLLTELVQRNWNVSGIEAIIARTYSTPDKSNIAALSRTAEEGASAGDTVSLRLLERNAGELCELAGTAYAGLGEQQLSLCLMGGLLTHDTLFRRLVTRRLHTDWPGILLKEPDMDAAAGAALWALTEL